MFKTHTQYNTQYTSDTCDYTKVQQHSIGMARKIYKTKTISNTEQDKTKHIHKQELNNVNISS